MARKRKSRASEPQDQQAEPQQAAPAPAPEAENEPNDLDGADEYEEVEEEVEDEIEEEDDNDEEEDDDDDEDDTTQAVNTEEANKLNGVEGEGEGEGEGGEGDDEPIEKLLEPFTKDQLATLLKEAVAKHPDFVENVKRLADLDPVHRKIFVHGLGWDTTSETLISVFGKYGEIEDCKAVTDKATGKSKGYGFILFKHRVGAKKALKEPQKQIGTRVTSCQLAAAGPVPAPPPTAPPVSEYTQRKIFVSNVGADVEPHKLLEFFSRFGEIEEGPLGLDKQTGKPKGFCLFVYKSIEGARKALEEPHKSFEGHNLNCQKAVDGPKPGKAGGGFYQQQHHHGQHHHPQQSYHGHTAKRGKYSGGSGSGGMSAPGGHLMAPGVGPAAVGFNPGMSPAALTPAIGQALALLATQGAGLGFGNLLGGIGAPATQGLGATPSGYSVQGGATGGYSAQGGATGGYGQPGLQGAYPNPQMGQGGVRPNQGGAPYMGHGH